MKKALGIKEKMNKYVLREDQDSCPICKAELDLYEEMSMENLLLLKN